MESNLSYIFLKETHCSFYHRFHHATPSSIPLVDYTIILNCVIHK